MTDNTHEIEIQKYWQEKFPSTLSGLFALYQCLCTIAIVGCEFGSILIDIFNATIYVGFWASIIFIVAWISQAITASCHTTRRYATYTLIFQCVALIFAGLVISFDAYFIVNPTTCFFSKLLCNSTAPVRGIFYSEDHFNRIKMPLIKGQLATAAVMFCFCIDYIIIYITTCIQIRKYQESLFIKPADEDVSNTTKTKDTPGVLHYNESVINASSLPSFDIAASTVTNDTVKMTSSNDSLYHSRWSFDSNDINPIQI